LQQCKSAERAIERDPRVVEILFPEASRVLRSSEIRFRIRLRGQQEVLSPGLAVLRSEIQKQSE
jgi:hypothetical protein